ncbi:hypothetical protein ACU8KH_05673 [Lachancea thermotolerans]
MTQGHPGNSRPVYRDLQFITQLSTHSYPARLVSLVVSSVRSIPPPRTRKKNIKSHRLSQRVEFQVEEEDR